MHRAPGSSGEEGPQCNASYNNSTSLSRHLRKTGHGASLHGRFTRLANENVIARMRMRYPNMVLGPNDRVPGSLSPRTSTSSPSLRGSRRSRYQCDTNATASVAAASSSPVVVSPSNTYPTSRSIATANAPPPSSLRGVMDSNAGARDGGPTREGRPMLVPLAELERARSQLHGEPPVPVYGAQPARDILPSPQLHLRPLLTGSFAWQTARSKVDLHP